MDSIAKTKGERQIEAVFLDRDGTVNEDRGYVYRRDQFAWIPGAVEAIASLNAHEILVIVVTNQAGVARGLYSVEDVEALHEYMDQELADSGARIDGYYYCPYHPLGIVDRYRVDDARCRKPNTGMLEDAASDFGIDPQKTYLVGDKKSDIDAGRGLGARTILVRTGYGTKWEPEVKADAVADDLRAAVDLILAECTTIR